MKELSIEQKAKAYDEAISMAKKFYTPDSNNVNLKATLEMIFPELKESEDERIRKELIKGFKESGWTHFSDELTINDAITWLEKQCEHANFRNKIQVGDKVTRNEDGVLVNLSQLNRVAKKQGEQKLPIEKLPFEMKTPEESLGIDSDTYSKIVDECVYGEQKSAWSEEDEKQARQIQRIVHDDGCTQKLQEQIADWLKSLKQRYTWKPSDEQIDALESAVSSLQSTALESLYRNLKGYE